jgi:hypothetical protein
MYVRVRVFKPHLGVKVYISGCSCRTEDFETPKEIRIPYRGVLF